MWFTDQNSKPLEIEDRINLTMAIKWSIYYKNEIFNWTARYGYEFLSFAKNMSKSLSNKCGQKLLDSAKKFITDAIKTASKRTIQKTADATGGLIGKKIADKITSVSNKKSTKELRNNDETEEDVEINTHKKRYILTEGRLQIIDELRLVSKNYRWMDVNKIVALQCIKMEYQKITNLLDNTSNQPSKFKTWNWVEINDDARGTYTGKELKFKTRMLRSNLCDYADVYILAITGTRDNAATRQSDERDKGVTFKNCARFTKWISRINSTDIDTAQDIDIVMLLYNLIENSNNYSKTSGSLWPNNNLADSESFKYKAKITGKTPDNGDTKDVEIIVPLKYLSNFFRTLEMSLINCEAILLLTWSKDCVITNSTGGENFQITETKLYVPVVTLSTQNNAKLLQQLKSGFKIIINWNKVESSKQTFCIAFWKWRW